jgi:tetratricopeptide (TPR) repeat protein
MRLLFTLLFLSYNLVAQTTEELFNKANNHYEQKEYNEALKLYNQIEETGIFSSEIYFNKANCYYKTNAIASAILYYEKALKLNPNDDDIQFNLGLTQLKLVDKLAVVPQPFYKKWISSLKNILTVDEWSKVGLLMMYLFFVLFIVFLFSNSYKLKRKAFSVSIVSLLLSVCAISIAYYSFSTQKEEAILMQDNAYVKSAPSEQSEDLFILHEGTKIERLEIFNEWSKIKLSDGMIGWVESSSIQLI